MSEWKSFTGTRDQYIEIDNAKPGVFLRYRDGSISPMHYGPMYKPTHNHITHYLICEKHPHHDMIVEWAKTGRPVELRMDETRWVHCTNEPVWNAATEYRFAEPEREVIVIRQYIYRTPEDTRGINICCKDIGRPPEAVEALDIFIRWIDNDWREIEV